MISVRIACPALTEAAIMGDSPSAMELASANGTRIYFGPDSLFLPSLAMFSLGSGDLSVRLAGVGPASPTEGAGADFRLQDASSPRSLDTFLTFRNGETATIRTTLADYAPALRFDLVSGTPAGFGLLLTITGADRLIFPQNGGFGVAALSGARELSAGYSSLALQNSVAQEGLAISCRGSGGGVRVAGVDGDRVFLSVSCSEVIVRAFRGDSLIALETSWQWNETAGGICRAGEPSGEVCPSEKGLKGAYWDFWSDKGRVFKSLKADPREAVFRFGHLVDQDGNTYEDMDFGGDLGLVYAEFPHGGKFSLTCRGLFTARFDLVSESFDLLNTDFIGGAAAGYQWGADSLELFFYHQSSHLGDEILDRDERERIDYGRETIRFLWSHEWNRFRFYGGPSYHIHALPEELDRKLWLQAGAEYRFFIKNRPLFIAGDFQSREEHDWSVNASGQIGFELGNPEKTSNRQWIFGEAFAGYSNMGQFWDRWERYLMIGVGYQWR